jgi:hypothetical protein
LWASCVQHCQVIDSSSFKVGCPISKQAEKRMKIMELAQFFGGLGRLAAAAPTVGAAAPSVGISQALSAHLPRQRGRPAPR